MNAEQQSRLYRHQSLVWPAIKKNYEYLLQYSRDPLAQIGACLYKVCMWQPRRRGNLCLCQTYSSAGDISILPAGAIYVESSAVAVNQSSFFRFNSAGDDGGKKGTWR